MPECRGMEASIYVNIAVAHAALGNIDAGFSALSTSLALGFDDFQALQANAMLEPLTAHPEYFNLLVK